MACGGEQTGSACAQVFDNWEGQPGAAVVSAGGSATRERRLLDWANEMEALVSTQVGGRLRVRSNDWRSLHAAVVVHVVVFSVGVGTTHPRPPHTSTCFGSAVCRAELIPAAEASACKGGMGPAPPRTYHPCRICDAMQTALSGANSDSRGSRGSASSLSGLRGTRYCACS